MLKIVIYHENYRLPDPHARKSNARQAKQIEKEDSHHRSVRRSKVAILDIMLSNRFDLWCTFTFNCRACTPRCNNKPCTCNPSGCKRYDPEYTTRVLRNWFRNQKAHSPNLKYLAVPEFHKSGAIHFHCLMSGFNGRMSPTKKRTKAGQTIYNARGYYSGFTEFVRIGERFQEESFSQEYERVAHYIAKYISKEMPVIHGGRRRYLVSEGLQRPRSIVNGLSKYALWPLVQNSTPGYINEYFEVHKIPLVGRLTGNKQHQLF